MPELPEVETIRRDLTAAIIGRRIAALNLLSPKSAKNDAAFFINFLVGREFDEINRFGKLLALRLKKKKGESDNYFLLIHLKMTGQLILEASGKKLAGGHSLSDSSFTAAIGGELPNKHTRVIIKFSGGGKLFFNDLRKFGYLKIVSQPELDRIVAAGYGPEPLTSSFTLKHLELTLKKRQTNIKALLLNQKLVAGLGNIYVDESLFISGIRPDRIASSLRALEIKKLYQAVNKVIKLAITNRGTTFSNYVDSAGKKGNFSRLLKVYGRGGQPCFKCRQVITKRKLAGRGTHFCENCQK